MNPTLQGYTAAVLEAAGSTGGDALRTLANDLEAIEQLVLANGPLNAALTDTTMRPAVRRAVMLDLLSGKVSDPARRLAAFACAAVRAPEVPAALGWVASRARHAAEGHGVRRAACWAWCRPVNGSAGSPPRCTRTSPRPSWSPSKTTFSASPGLWAPPPHCVPPLRIAIWRSRRGQALVTQLLEGKVRSSTVSVVRYAVAGGRARDIVGTLDWLVEQTAKARGLAHCPGAGGGAHRRERNGASSPTR